MNEFKSKYSKETVSQYMKTNPEEEDINYYWTKGFIFLTKQSKII